MARSRKKASSLVATLPCERGDPTIACKFSARELGINESSRRPLLGRTGRARVRPCAPPLCRRSPPGRSTSPSPLLRCQTARARAGSPQPTPPGSGCRRMQRRLLHASNDAGIAPGCSTVVGGAMACAATPPPARGVPSPSRRAAGWGASAIQPRRILAQGAVPKPRRSQRLVEVVVVPSLGGLRLTGRVENRRRWSAMDRASDRSAARVGGGEASRHGSRASGKGGEGGAEYKKPLHAGRRAFFALPRAAYGPRSFAPLSNAGLQVPERRPGRPPGRALVRWCVCLRVVAWPPFRLLPLCVALPAVLVLRICLFFLLRSWGRRVFVSPQS